MLRKILRNFLLFSLLALNALRGLPHLMILYFTKNRPAITADTKRWLDQMDKELKMPYGFLYLMVFYPQFRNIFYYRIKTKNVLLNILFPKVSTLTIASGEIGEGLYIPHGFSTTIGARSIGKNCSINHNVTIGGFKGNPRPVILDNVVINAGAVLYGNITIGNNVIIGANATVNTNIPVNSTVFPPQSRIMKWRTEVIRK